MEHVAVASGMRTVQSSRVTVSANRLVRLFPLDDPATLFTLIKCT